MKDFYARGGKIKKIDVTEMKATYEIQMSGGMEKLFETFEDEKEDPFGLWINEFSPGSEKLGSNHHEKTAAMSLGNH
ncbi:MAG: hypothetical protein HQM14_10635 [SAR324 cluster bacterium]|nr:hypothetical protein [SAR324 cluster bacterium]